MLCASKQTREEAMVRLEEVFRRNREWVEQMRAEDPTYFETLAQGQKPRFLWIGCADSRVPATRVTGLEPGEVFVHRNIANLVGHGDLNVLSVVEYAVRNLRVEHVIVCGHYGCGGVQTAMGDRSAGLLDNWLRHVMDVYHEHSAELAALPEGPERVNRLCELNAIAQVANLSRTTVIQEAWREGRNLSVHGWIYNLADGLLKDLEVSISGLEELPTEYCVE